MIRVFLNGLAASAGAGLTYIRNVVPHLSGRQDVQTIVAITPSLRSELGNPPNVSFLEVESRGAARRFWQEQTLLPQLIRRSGADLLISAGNFALRNSPVPQILLSGNSLYTSRDFYRDLRVRQEYGMWLDTRIRGFLARRSVHWADCTVTPSQAFAEELRNWAGGNIVSIYHGFDADAFFRGGTPLAASVQQKLNSADSALRILFVSHYTYYRNFETLLRAIPVLRERLRPRELRLFLTCRFAAGANPGSYRTESTSALIRELDIADQVIELGAIDYYSLHKLYRSSHIYATAAYAETFAHPLVEAMASGIPVVASDLRVHREICGEAALYFSRFSPDEFADRVMEIASSTEISARLAAKGAERARDFDWKKHVEQIVFLATQMLRTGTAMPENQVPA